MSIVSLLSFEVGQQYFCSLFQRALFSDIIGKCKQFRKSDKLFKGLIRQ